MSLAGYSAFDHLISALFLAPESLMAIITAPDPLTLYCDANKAVRDQSTIVGAIASIADWKELDSEWSKILKHEHLNIFSYERICAK